MRLTGKAEGKTLRGRINRLEELQGYSAYEVAVINGFVGTEEEWLASLRPSDEQVAQAVADYMAKNPTEGGSKATIGEVTLLASEWEGSNSLYSQKVEVAGVTGNSQVDLTPSVEQLAIFYEKDLTFVTENDGGVVTVYAIGQKPANDYTIQVTITEVSV